MIILKHPRGLAHNMDDPLSLTQTPHNAIQGTELSNPMRCDEDTRYAFGTSISIRGISSVELVGIANHVQAIDLVDIVKKLEIEVAGYALRIESTFALENRLLPVSI